MGFLAASSKKAMASLQQAVRDNSKRQLQTVPSSVVLGLVRRSTVDAHGAGAPQAFPK